MISLLFQERKVEPGDVAKTILLIPGSKVYAYCMTDKYFIKMKEGYKMSLIIIYLFLYLLFPA